ncbi:MAG: hypothetical protein WD396_07120 [Pseudohongiellaceae bacterium]
MSKGVRVPVPGTGLLATALLLIMMVMPNWAGAQRLAYTKGEPLFPAYEGWTDHADGSRSFLFGYMNENWEQTLNIPVGENNYFSPAPQDQGQPTYFLPRRNRFVFEVPVPEGFGEEDEFTWTVQANGHSYSAHATLRQDYYVDNVVIMSETGALGAGTSSPEIRANEPPAIALEGREQLRSTRVGQALTLVAKVTDDGQPPAEGFRNATAPEPDATSEELLQRALTQTSGSTVAKAVGLHFTWTVYRGPGDAVAFDPPQIKPWEDTRQFANSPWAPYWVPPELRKPSELPEDGRWHTEVVFQQPGTYVLRGRADDGGLFADQYVTVQVAAD